MSAFQEWMISEVISSGLDQMVSAELAKGRTTAAEIVDALGGGPYTVEMVADSLERLGRSR